MGPFPSSEGTETTGRRRATSWYINLRDQLVKQMAHRQDWFSFVAVYSQAYPAPYRMAAILSVTLALMFMNAMLYSLAFPRGTCSQQATKATCLAPALFYHRTHQTYCQWSTLRQQCTYIPPADGDAFLICALAFAAHALALPLHQLLVYLFEHLLLPPTLSPHLAALRRQLQAEKKKEDTQAQGGLRVQPLQAPDVSDTYVHEHFGIRSPVEAGAGAAASGAPTSTDAATSAREAETTLVPAVPAPVPAPSLPFWRSILLPHASFSERPSSGRGGSGLRTTDPQVCAYQKEVEYQTFIDSETAKVYSRALQQHQELTTATAKLQERLAELPETTMPMLSDRKSVV